MELVQLYSKTVLVDCNCDSRLQVKSRSHKLTFGSGIVRGARDTVDTCAPVILAKKSPLTRLFCVLIFSSSERRCKKGEEHGVYHSMVFTQTRRFFLFGGVAGSAEDSLYISGPSLVPRPENEATLGHISLPLQRRNIGT